MIEVFKWVKGINQGDMRDVLKLVEKTRNNGFKLDKFRFRKDIGKYWFGKRVVDLWNKLPSAVVGAKSVDSFKLMLVRYKRYLPCMGQ